MVYLCLFLESEYVSSDCMDTLAEQLNWVFYCWWAF